MSNRTLAIIACVVATSIYAISHTIAKGPMPDYVQPFAFICARLIVATALFWILGLFGPKEKVDRKDWPRFLLCGALGMCINMLAFFKGLSLSTPINSAVLMTVSPILVVLLSAIIIKEKIHLKRAIGIGVGFLGALGLVLFGAETRADAPNILLGNILLLTNATAFGLYLIFVKKLLNKYHPFTAIKWLFTIGTVLCLPVALPQFLETDWFNLPTVITLKVLFIIIATTFLTYLFNIFSIKHLKASTVSSFIYLQPLFGIIFAIFSKQDSLTPIKISSAILIIIGVYLASKKPITK